MTTTAAALTPRRARFLISIAIAIAITAAGTGVTLLIALARLTFGPIVLARPTVSRRSFAQSAFARAAA
jgi:hypothetical protein